MSKLNRDRGAGTEREVCKYLEDRLREPVKRRLGQARDSGEDISIPPFRIEVKRRRRFVAQGWMQQCETGSRPDEIPVVVIRVDGDTEPMALIRLEDLTDWMRTMRDDWK